ncbi:MAG: hypothetical protein ABIW80_06485 [Lapillicoccus sp.]
MLLDVGVDRRAISRQVAGARWRLHGKETVAMHTQPLTLRARAWRALWEVRREDAAIDGVSSLQIGGLTGFDAMAIDVSVPWPVKVPMVPGVRTHRVCRLPDELVLSGIPRVRAPLATIRGANWAASDRQAALVLALPVQQRLLVGAHLADAERCDRVRGRRALVRQLVRDIVDGAHSLGELDFAQMCRRRGLPEPDRQVVMQTKKGSIYLDVRWSSIGLVVEINGAGHVQGLEVSRDNLRQNGVTLSGDMVLSFDLVAMRLMPDEVLDQVVAAHGVLNARRAS